MSIQLAARGHHVFRMRRYVKGERSPVSAGTLVTGDVVMSGANIRVPWCLHQRDMFPLRRQAQRSEALAGKGSAVTTCR